MSARLRKKVRDRTPQKNLDKLLRDSPPVEEPDPLICQIAESVVKQAIMEMDIPEETVMNVENDQMTEEKTETNDHVEPEKEKSEPEPIKPAAPLRPMLWNKDEFDTLKPEETIGEFCKFVQNCLSTYDYDKDQLTKCEDQMQDLLHYAEMSEKLNSKDGNRLYRKLNDIRRKRRMMKSEIELLTPVYELFHGTKILDQLKQVKGNCKSVRKTIEARRYTARTDILDSFYEKS